MNWLNDCPLIWHWHGYGFEPWYVQIKLSFCQNSFWHECERLETLVEPRGTGKTTTKKDIGKPWELSRNHFESKNKLHFREELRTISETAWRSRNIVFRVWKGLECCVRIKGL